MASVVGGRQGVGVNSAWLLMVKQQQTRTYGVKIRPCWTFFRWTGGKTPGVKRRAVWRLAWHGMTQRMAKPADVLSFINIYKPLNRGDMQLVWRHFVGEVFMQDGGFISSWWHGAGMSFLLCSFYKARDKTELRGMAAAWDFSIIVIKLEELFASCMNMWWQAWHVCGGSIICQQTTKYGTLCGVWCWRQ